MYYTVQIIKGNYLLYENFHFQKRTMNWCEVNFRELLSWLFNNGWADSLTLEKQALKSIAKMNEFITIRVIASLVLLNL
jgi:hypothetical protein